MYTIVPELVNRHTVVYKTKNNYGQILNMKFECEEYDTVVYWYVCLWIGKRKFGYQSLKQTGKDGIKSLLWAKQCVINFLEYVSRWDDEKRKQHICVGSDNGHRRQVYERGLRDLGFTPKRIERSMWLHKCIEYA